MQLRIAIPEPSSLDTEYNQRALPPYLAALHSAGAVPLIVPLHERPNRIARLLAEVHGVLLPGSRYDVEPERFNESRIAECGPSDPGRTAADELLLQDAFNLRKPILAICRNERRKLPALPLFCHRVVPRKLLKRSELIWLGR
ncbi:MAG: gamma-glutamyl-gamma-aminobutyrate hydrolase family protein [Terracidiphilus sp.]